MVINKLIKKVKYYFTASPLSFLLRFALSFSVLYLTGKALIGIAAPGGKLYLTFFKESFNPIQLYTEALRSSVLGIINLFSIDGIKYNHTAIKTNMVTIQIGYSCLGIGLISFWQSFVIAHNQKITQLFKWIILGTLALYILNVLRLSMLIIGTHLHWIRWNKFDIDNHHFIYNTITYILLLVACFFLTRNLKLLFSTFFLCLIRLNTIGYTNSSHH